MEDKDSSRKEIFNEALKGKNIPVLTLDHKWYRLLKEFSYDDVKQQEEKLNLLLKKQGKLNTEIKGLKSLKKKLMNEIVVMVNEVENNHENKNTEKKIEENKRLLEECNEKIDANQDALLECPREIEQLNRQLMLKTMDYCYEIIQSNTDEIELIEKWVTEIRIELKKRLIRKQEIEQKNYEIYSYMHDLFGAEVLDLFDVRYDPSKQHPIPKVKGSEENKG